MAQEPHPSNSSRCAEFLDSLILCCDKVAGTLRATRKAAQEATNAWGHAQPIAAAVVALFKGLFGSVDPGLA
ncbi:hypothetical protein ACFU9B_43960 [Streptomyces sp. NPDC057592]|uniref:hypothetical protein n=1 Tax=unclassified Streptomyces TaxID=2593676 RepID=UPI00367FB281